MSPLAPNPKAGTPPLPPGSEACGCCEGIDIATPQRHASRHGLPAVEYRIGRWAQFRESMIDGLSHTRFAPLGRLLTRDPDDFTIGLIDAFACSADVLSFYQERIANESWLRTATERVSLQEMARLIGYRLRPGVAAETWLAFALEPPRMPPAGASKDPGGFVTGIPGQLHLKAGLKVQSVPGPDEKPQTFETIEDIVARPQWNAMRPWLSRPRVPDKGDTSTWLQGVNTGLRPGDALLIVGAEFEADPTSERWDFRVLSEVEPDTERDRTRVAWNRGLGSQSPAVSPAGTAVRVFALRQRASVYGHNAPMWRTMPYAFKSSYDSSHPQHAESWPDYLISTASETHVDLDAAYPAIAPGGFAVLARGQYDYPVQPAPSGTYVELYRIEAVSEVSREEFALSGKSTRLGLTGENHFRFRSHVRGTKVFAQSEELQFARYPVETAVAGDAIEVAVAPEGLAAGRRIIVQGSDATGTDFVHEAVLTGAARPDGDGAILDIAPSLPVALARESVVIAGNVAPARHGETVTQILGSGNASEPHQRFELKQLPLTWRSAANELGAASELTVRVDGIEWKQRPTLYGSGPRERAYTLQTDESGRDWLLFGDGRAGARLPSGDNNLRASYRKGIGKAGDVRAETLTQPMTRPLGLKGVANPSPARGGGDPEPAAHARESMPLGTRTLGRVVSLLDYEDYARAYADIAKARAEVLHFPYGPVVGITVAGQGGDLIAPGNPVWGNLRDALRDHGDPQVELKLMGCQASTFRLGLKVKCDPDYEQDAVLEAVEAALRLAFAFQARRLGQPVQQSEVIATTHAVPGVIAVDLDLLYGGTDPHAQTLPGRHVRLLASRMRVAGGIALPAELLTLDPGPLDHLEPMP